MYLSMVAQKHLTASSSNTIHPRPCYSNSNLDILLLGDLQPNAEDVRALMLPLLLSMSRIPQVVMVLGCFNPLFSSSWLIGLRFFKC
jgi:hypothetical protein